MTENSNQGRPIGYARVSKEEQHLGLQLDALKKHGVIRLFTDKQTGTRFDRKAFLAALAYLNEGDTLVVWKLDWLGRSLKELIETVEHLQKRNVALVSLTEHIETTPATPTHMMGYTCLRFLLQQNVPSSKTQLALEAFCLHEELAICCNEYFEYESTII